MSHSLSNSNSIFLSNVCTENHLKIRQNSTEPSNRHAKTKDVQIEGTTPLSLVNIIKQDRKTRWGHGVYSPLLKATNKQWRRDIPMFNKL
jgi:hypothetical protein